MRHKSRLSLSSKRVSRSSAPQAALPLVGIIMGSESDWETMSGAAETLEQLAVPFEVRVISAHRTPDLLFDYAATAKERGLKLIIAGAGGAAHLPGMTASKCELPVLGVPVESRVLRGVDSLLSIVQMPAGVPVATFAIGRAGAVNAALFAASVLAHQHAAIEIAFGNYRVRQTERVLAIGDPRSGSVRKVTGSHARRAPKGRVPTARSRK